MLQRNGVVGMIAEMAWYVYTLNWPCDPNRFPMRHACLVGIQVIPITAVSKYWVDQVSLTAQRVTHIVRIIIHKMVDSYPRF